ncbi:MAG: hypothetical protein IKQ80_03100 [Clostridia bacterium]|nr:hypothetical protein [Clostridia bacterium]
MKKRILKKLRAKAGETLAETLIALLISALALMMLAGAITAASNVLSKSKNSMNTYNTETLSGVIGAWETAASTVLK